MLSIKSYNRKKDSAILVIFSVACIGVATISHPNHINALNNKNNNTGIAIALSLLLLMPMPFI